MKTSAGLISCYCLLRIHDFINSSGKFISKVALPLSCFYIYIYTEVFFVLIYSLDFGKEVSTFSGIHAV